MKKSAERNLHGTISIAVALVAAGGCSTEEAQVVQVGRAEESLVEESIELELWELEDYQEVVHVAEKSGEVSRSLLVDVAEKELTDFRSSEAKPAIVSDRHSKVAPNLERQISKLDPADTIEVLISVAHNSPFGRLTQLDRDEPRDSEENLERMNTRASEIASVEIARAATRMPLIRVVDRLGGKVLEEHTFGNGVLVAIPVHAIEDIEAEPSVLEVAARFSGTPPPAATIAAARTKLNSDPWYSGGYDGSVVGFHVGLLDTGIRNTHTVFTSGGGGLLGVARDCVNGNASCVNSPVNPSYSTQDIANHGTGSANIVMGGNSASAGWGANFRGTSKVELDYFKVYTADGLDDNALVRGIARAVALADDLIIGEVQSQTTDSGLASLAADDAFDTGTAIVSAVGNDSQVDNVGAPGNAHKVLAIGDYDAVTEAVVSQISGGVDSRYKPDIQFPTNVDAASNSSNTAKVTGFSGTSGATAFAGGAAAILYDYHHTFGSTEPGRLYTSILARGTSNAGGSSSDGAGKFKFTLGGSSWSGKITLGTVAQTVDIAIPAGKKNLRVAIWWPEGQADAHNDVDLRVLNSANVSLSSSASSGSVWELGTVSGNLAAGTYKLKFEPFSMPRPSQVVYYTAVVVPQ